MEKINFTRTQYTDIEMKRLSHSKETVSGIIWGAVMGVSAIILALSMIEYVRSGGLVFFGLTIVLVIFITLVGLVNHYNLMDKKVKDL